MSRPGNSGCGVSGSCSAFCLAVLKAHAKWSSPDANEEPTSHGCSASPRRRLKRFALDEHWDGAGQPYALKGYGIPLLARILGLAQTVEVFFSTYGPDAAFDMAAARRGSWFDPALVEAFLTLRKDRKFWQALAVGDTLAHVAAVEPDDEIQVLDDRRLDLVAEAFALVIDAKSRCRLSPRTTTRRRRARSTINTGVRGGRNNERRRLISTECDVPRDADSHLYQTGVRAIDQPGAGSRRAVGARHRETATRRPLPSRTAQRCR